MQQYLILAAIISVVVAQPCEVWRQDQKNCIIKGCAFCGTSCSTPPSPFTGHCHYGDFAQQPVGLANTLPYISQSPYVFSYNGYDNYYFYVNDPKSTITLKVDPFTPGSVEAWASQLVAQPDFNNFSWALGYNTTFSIVGTSTVPLKVGPLYIGVYNRNSRGYEVTASASF